MTWTGDPLDCLSVEAAEAACERSYQQGRRDALDDAATGPDGRPNCGYCAERLRVNVGLMEENRQLKRKLEQRRGGSA